jgi:hypothetical protein
MNRKHPPAGNQPAFLDSVIRLFRASAINSWPADRGSRDGRSEGAPKQRPKQLVSPGNGITVVTL